MTPPIRLMLCIALALFGVRTPAASQDLATFEFFKYHDANVNGVWDFPGEALLSGWQIRVVDAATNGELFEATRGAEGERLATVGRTPGQDHHKKRRPYSSKLRQLPAGFHIGAGV